jgi:uncharacterized membrane protein
MYGLVKTLHVLSAAVLFGTGLGMAFFQYAAYRSKDLGVFAGVARLTVLADWLFTASAVIAQPVTGVLLLRMGGYAWDAPWLLWSYGLYLVTGLCWLPVVWMQMRITKLAARARDEQQPLPAEARRLMRLWFWCGWPAFGAVLAIYWLMIVKPA